MRNRLPVIVAVFLLAVAASHANEVVFFTNGTQMIVQGHAVDTEKNMIRLDLGGGSAIAFPAAMVEKIDVSGRNVYLGPTLNPTNRAASGSGQLSGGTMANGAAGSTAGSWTGSKPPTPRYKSQSERRRQMLDPEQQMAYAQSDETWAGQPASGPAGARMRSMARPRDAAPTDPMGAAPAPDGKYQIGASPTQRRVAVAFGPRGSEIPAAPVNPNEQPAAPPADDPGTGGDAGTDGGGGSEG
jgi:hypothetical protein